MKHALEGLINLLEDEFSSYESVRVSPIFPSTTRRAVDLQQDYDPESSSLHTESGVRVMTDRHEFFFPLEWFDEPGHSAIHAQVEQIRGQLIP